MWKTSVLLERRAIPVISIRNTCPRGYLERKVTLSWLVELAIDLLYFRLKMRPSGWLGSQNIWFFGNNHSIQFRVRRLRLLAKRFPIEPFLNLHPTIHGKPFSMAYPNSVALLMLMCIRLTETILHQTVDTDSLQSFP